MFNFKKIAIAALFALATLGFAQTDTLTVTGTKPAATVTVLLTDGSGVDFGSAYSITGINTTSFAYGGDFLISVDYTNVATGGSIQLDVKGSQLNYDFAYRYMAGADTAYTKSDVAFSGTAAVLGSAAASGSATAQFAAGTGGTTAPAAFDSWGANTGATKFGVGVKAQASADADVNTTVTITATVL